MTDRHEDHRVTCQDCRHFQARNWRCVNARQAQLQRRIGVESCDIGPELSQLPQDCPGYAPKESK